MHLTFILGLGAQSKSFCVRKYFQLLWARWAQLLLGKKQITLPGAFLNNIKWAQIIGFKFDIVALIARPHGRLLLELIFRYEIINLVIKHLNINISLGYWAQFPSQT